MFKFDLKKLIVVLNKYTNVMQILCANKLFAVNCLTKLIIPFSLFITLIVNWMN